MGILTRDQIVEAIKRGDLSFSPAVDALQLRPHSIDLRLSSTFHVPRRSTDEESGRHASNLHHHAIHHGHLAYYDLVELDPGQYFDILPGESVLGFSHEEIDLASPELMGELFPRSSVTRRGLAIDLTGIVDAGYKGRLMLPIRNTTSAQVIRVYPGERIGQLVIERLEQPVTEGYQGRFAKKPNGTLSPTFQTSANEDEAILLREGKLDVIKEKYRDLE